MRSKEDAKDYRYFPDPDLPPIHISDAWIEKIKAEQPELREVKQARYQEEYGLPAYDAGILTESRHLAGLFEETAAIYGNAKKTANWFMGEVLRRIRGPPSRSVPCGRFCRPPISCRWGLPRGACRRCGAASWGPRKKSIPNKFRLRTFL